MKKIHRLLIVSLAMLFLLLINSPVRAGEEKIHFHDAQGVMTEQEAEDLNDELAKFSQDKQVEFIAIFVDNGFSGTSSEYQRFSEDLFHDSRFDYGYDPEKSGVVMLIDMNQRKIDVRAFGKAKPIFMKESNIDKVTDKVGKKLRDEEYIEAVRSFVNQSYRLYRKYNQSFIEKMFGTMFSFKGLIVALIGSLIAGAVALGGHNQSTKAGAKNYEISNSFLLHNKQDFFTHKNVTSRQIQSSSSRSGGGGSRSSGGGSSSSGGSSGGTRSF